MTIADPKNYAKKKAEEHDDADGEGLQAQIAALKQQVEALLAAKSGDLGEDRLEKVLMRVAQMSADAQERAANPSNKTHPAISVYSKPLGDREDPRPALKCPMFWVGFPIDHDTNTADEIDLFNQAEPGIFSFRCSDGSTEQLTVAGDRDPAGKVSRLLFTFVLKDATKNTAMADILRSAFKVKTAEQIEIELLRSQVAAFQTVGAV